ncbi:MAG: hypothetical protein WDA20_05270 [Desulfuromonadales bacterium]
MIDLNLAVQDGAAIYLDVQCIEARQTRSGETYALTGTLGDGRYEGQVLVEIGDRVEVTFVDDWLGMPEMHEFFRRTERDAVDAALTSAAARMRFCIENFPVMAGQSKQRVTGYIFDNKWISLRPQEYAEQMELPLTVAEHPVAWQRRAA